MPTHLYFRENLPESVLGQIPILHQTRRLLEIIYANGGIKMTPAGYLPVKIVQELYPLGVPEYWYEIGYYKSLREDKIEFIRLMRFLAQTCGAVRMYKGKLVLTKNGKRWMAEPNKLLRVLFYTVSYAVNNGGMDMYGMGNINGHIPLLCTLLALYGSEPKAVKFYMDELSQYCPGVFDELQVAGYGTLEQYREDCFCARLIRRGLGLFGFAERIKGEADVESDNREPSLIEKKPLLDEVFELKETEDEDKIELMSALQDIIPYNDKPVS